MVEIETEVDGILDELNKLKNEMRIVLLHTKSLRNTDNDVDHRHFSYTLCGFVMLVMSKIDYLSKHFVLGENNQTKRMVRFLRDYLGYSPKASEIGVQFFRHNLMHTSTLAEIKDEDGKTYLWLLHHGDSDDLPRDQHMMLNGGKLDAGVFYFVDDLISAIPKLLRVFEGDSNIRNEWKAVEKEMRIFKKYYTHDGTEIA